MPKASLAVQILPLYDDQARSLAAIERVIDMIRQQADHVVVSPFETTIEGDFHELMDLLTRVIEVAGQDGENIFVNTKIRYHKEGQMLSSEAKTNKYR
ncbi:thiamine-binding protein [Fundicoccus culcitae]|uniref:Thiamine-binding protein n=1 Tax=Fundicoccus culcitae TaxID=2969821 RepID=A0ABY5P2R5_9LACT|nr:thiamine-binding protein [Fundicoccus culcitae]UUX32997.1 thiamine-binding protein [Fundicoccus culcitae]